MNAPTIQTIRATLDKMAACGVPVWQQNLYFENALAARALAKLASR